MYISNNNKHKLVYMPMILKDQRLPNFTLNETYLLFNDIHKFFVLYDWYYT